MRKLALIILDGWGIGEPGDHNAIHVAQTPFFDELWNGYPKTTLQASGEHVGLPSGQIGGSEVGHMTIGAGRVIYHELVRINRSLNIADSEEYIEHNENFTQFVKYAEAHTVHLIGLISNGGVHSHIEHLLRLLELLKAKGCKEPWIHFISDGRDTTPTSGTGFAQDLLNKINSLQFGKVATLSGRFYAMDRDKNFDRTDRAIQVMAEGVSTSAVQLQLEQVTDDRLLQGFELNYAQSVSDEFIEPLVIDRDYKGMSDQDGIFFFNFRSDRMKQLITRLSTVVDPENIYTMTQYDKDYSYKIFFAKHQSKHTLPEYLSNKKLTQLKVAESEKFPHVTYFFNGGVEIVFEGESRRVVESNKVTHDIMPEMKAQEITEAIMSFVDESHPDFILVNFANPDMVGHTGNTEAIVRGVETVDVELKKLCGFLAEKEYISCITADHGNADIMFDPVTHEIHTAHTLNPVPFIVYDSVDAHNQKIELDQHPDNSLALIAGTILELMGMPESTFKSLIKH